MQENLKEYGQDTMLAAEKTNGIGEAEKAALGTLATKTRNG